MPRQKSLDSRTILARRVAAKAERQEMWRRTLKRKQLRLKLCAECGHTWNDHWGKECTYCLIKTVGVTDRIPRRLRCVCVGFVRREGDTI